MHGFKGDLPNKTSIKPPENLQLVTKLLRHCTQIGKLQRTKESTPLPCPLHSKLGCLLFSKGSSNTGTTLHGGDGGGKVIFRSFEVSKT